MATFNFNGRLSATVRIRGKTYTLVGDSSTQRSTRLKLEYHKPFDDAVVVGTMRELLDEIESSDILQLKGKFDEAGWEALERQAKALPGLGPIFTAVFPTVLGTQLRVTDILLELEAPNDAAPSQRITNGTLELGIGFDCRHAAPNNKVLGIALETVGMLLHFDYHSPG